VRATHVPRTAADLLAALPPDWPRSEVRVPNGTLAVRAAEPLDAATAAPALFVHGLGGQSTNWTDLMAMLRDRLDGVAVDLPGFGWSPPPLDGDWTPRRTADTLADLVRDRWGGEPVHVFGNSMGGAVAVQLAARHPALVRTLTLVSPALPRIVPRRTSIHLPVVATPGIGRALMDKYLTLPADRRARATVSLCFADPSTVPSQRFEDATAEVRRRDALPYVQEAFTQSLRGLLATYLDASSGRPWKLAERITAPTLLVYGHRDKLVDPIAAHTTAFPDRRVVLLMNCGHVAQIEAPDLVAEAWRELLPVTGTQ
jgi:pimeloyl-ACP methyl ester carboxylesterase